MESSLFIACILMVAILWTETLAKRCPSHCRCDYRGSSYCTFGNCNVTLNLKDLGTAHSALHINCADVDGIQQWHVDEDVISVPNGVPESEDCLKGINFSCSDFPELEVFEVYKYTSYRCPPRILRCLKYILKEVQINTVTLNTPSEVLLKEDAADFKDVTALWIMDLKDDMIINSDTIYGWPSLSKIHVLGGTLQLSPNNNITNKSLKKISLTSVNICSFPEGGFSGLTNLKTFESHNVSILHQNYRLDMCELEHIHIHAGAFKGLGELEVLYIDNVQYIEPGTFVDTPKLRNVFLINSPLQSLPDGLFEGMPALYEIFIQCRGNEIAIGTHVFTQNVALNTVTVSHCKHSNLSENLFSYSNNITRIEIKYNQIANMSPKTFSHLSALEFINLNGNGIDLTNQVYFDKLTSLQTLGLGDNGIKNIHENAFSNLYSLSALWLYYNDIQEIPEKLFCNLTSLEILLLNDNKIQKLPESVFINLNGLTDLELQNNNIYELPEGIFTSLTSLSSLSIAQNNLSELHENSFTNLTSLLELDLSNNSLEELPKNIFTSLTSLNKLKLHTNKIWELPDFSNLISLMELDLSNNHIVRLSPYSFDKLRNLEKLTLRNNAISKLEAYDPESPYALYPSERINYDILQIK